MNSDRQGVLEHTLEQLLNDPRYRRMVVRLNAQGSANPTFKHLMQRVAFGKATEEEVASFKTTCDQMSASLTEFDNLIAQYRAARAPALQQAQQQISAMEDRPKRPHIPAGSDPTGFTNMSVTVPVGQGGPPNPNQRTRPVLVQPTSAQRQASRADVSDNPTGLPSHPVEQTARNSVTQQPTISNASAQAQAVNFKAWEASVKVATNKKSRRDSTKKEDKETDGEPPEFGFSFALPSELVPAMPSYPRRPANNQCRQYQ